MTHQPRLSNRVTESPSAGESAGSHDTGSLAAIGAGDREHDTLKVFSRLSCRKRWRAFALFVVIAWLGSPPQAFSQEFRAGAAKVKITPTELGWLGGYGHRNRPAEGVAADLWARALALEDHLGQRRVLVNADIHIFTRSLHREIVATARQRFGLLERDIMLIATHTHSGPALPEGFDPLISWDLSEAEMQKLRTAAARIRDGTLDAMARALLALAPARLGFARTEARFGVNRRVRGEHGDYNFGANLDGVSDPDVPVLLVETPEGTPRAVLFTYACHNTTIRNGHEGFYRYHPDYAGVAAEEIEQQHPGATAIYVTGAAGEIDPQPQGPVRQAELHGKALAAAVLAALPAARRHPVRGRSAPLTARSRSPWRRPRRGRSTSSSPKARFRIAVDTHATFWGRSLPARCRRKSRSRSRSGGSARTSR